MAKGIHIWGYRDWFLEQLGMYAAYHRDRRNQLTHHVGVPLIVFSLLVALSQVTLARGGDVTLTAATVVLGLLLAGYVVAVPLVGGFTAIFYAGVHGLALEIASLSSTLIWSIAGGGFVAGWIIQFLGHVFEGRRPALTVNALQIFMAPPFLIAEILFALGVEKELERQLQHRALSYLPAPGAP